MADRPILFSGPMVQALIGGRKTQTRRIIKDAPSEPGWMCYRSVDGRRTWIGPNGYPSMPCVLRFAKGDRLWVRESFWVCEVAGHGIGVPFLVYDDEWTTGPGAKEPKPAEPRDWIGTRRFGKRPGIHMPRWASRLTLTVTDVRVERLQDISETDALAEGVIDTGRRDGAPYGHCIVPGMPEITMEHEPSSVFASLWEHINDVGSWQANPWVCVVSFTVARGNIDT